MVRAAAAWFALVLVCLGSPAAQDPQAEALREMIETERAFARAATIIGVRDAFLEYFADDALALTPLPISAKEGLRKQPPRPFSVQELVWEPRAGDVAASGEMGWLTGPAAFANHEANRKGYSCYLSVWRKQPDGRWRVFIDVGITSPKPVPFASGFTRVAVEDRYTGPERGEAVTRSLAEAEASLNADIRSRGIGAAYRERLTPSSRLHRNGTVPVTGAAAIAAWLTGHTEGVSAKAGAAEASRAGDLGYSYGTYEVAGSAPEKGPYVRTWSRDRAGRWHLMADVAHPVQ